MRQQGPEARFDAARQIDALPQHDGSAQNLGIPLAQFGIADQYDREGRRRKVVQMFENLYTVVACQVAAKPDAVDVVLKWYSGTLTDMTFWKSMVSSTDCLGYMRD